MLMRVGDALTSYRDGTTLCVGASAGLQELPWLRRMTRDTVAIPQTLTRLPSHELYISTGDLYISTGDNRRREKNEG